MKSTPVAVTIKSPQPATDFPGTMLHAHLKQIDIPALEARTRQAIEECFPQFASDPSREWDKSLRAHGANAQPDTPISEAFTAGGYYDLTQGRFRRYAGGKDLPGARYFALCRDASGNDGGTLCYELMSYWDSTSGWFLGLTDSTVHREAIARSPLARVLADQDPVLLIIASPIDEIKVGKTREPFPTGQTHPILVPLRVVEIACDNVLDLRFPDAQEWLAQRCGGKGSHSFLELLPISSLRVLAETRSTKTSEGGYGPTVALALCFLLRAAMYSSKAPRLASCLTMGGISCPITALNRPR